MKKIVLIFGLIAGFIITVQMVYFTALRYDNPDFKTMEIVGFASMLVAFSFIFLGIKNYRDNYNNGVISFGKAFKTGALIALVASTVYVVTWLFEYYLFVPDFMDQYTEHVISAAKAEGASQAEIAHKAEEMAGYSKMYENPVFVVLLTFMEVLPVGLVIALISALILKRKQQDPQTI
jgi:hypothetical protein